MRGQPDPRRPAFIDKVGLALLVVWVGALQIMLDEGRNQDWFNSPEICVLAAVAAIGFVAFLIWELTEKNPIVDLKIFRHRGFVAAATTYAVGFGAFFASIVLLPLWLQSNMGYTATWAGYATGIMGIFAVVTAPLVGKAVEKVDARLIVSLGILGLGLIMVWRMGFNADVTFLQMAWPTLLTGPLHGDVLRPRDGPGHGQRGARRAGERRGPVELHAHARRRLRHLAGADRLAERPRENQTELAGVVHYGRELIEPATAQGARARQATAMLAQLVEGQSVMLATLDMFAVIAVCFGVAATLIWIAPKPQGPIDTSGAH
jgi:DHA2 family multidrug resistance protein